MLLVRLLPAVTDLAVPGKIQDAGSFDWWDVSSPPIVNTPEPAHQVFPIKGLKYWEQIEDILENGGVHIKGGDRILFL